jgi:hypothetical protein
MNPTDTSEPRLGLQQIESDHRRRHLDGEVRLSATLINRQRHSIIITRDPCTKQRNGRSHLYIPDRISKTGNVDGQSSRKAQLQTQIF